MLPVGRRRAPANRRDERGRVNPVLVVAGTIVVALVVTLVVSKLSGSDSQRVATGQTIDTAEPTLGNICGDGQPDPSYTVTIASDPDPPRPDGTIFHLTVRHAGKAVVGAKVCLTADMPDMEHSGVSRVSKETSDGKYDAELKFGMGGAWAASVTIAEPGKPSVTVPVQIQVNEN